MAARRPGGEMSTRPLHFIIIADTSYSMQGEKIASLNFAIRESLPYLARVADDNPNATVWVRCLSFDSSVKWHIEDPVRADKVKWDDLRVGGITKMGEAMCVLADALKIENLGDRALPPVLVLLSDGQPSDDFQAGLVVLMKQPWARKAVRLAIAIGEDADENVLRAFIDGELPVLTARNSDQLTGFIKWASTAVVASASSPTSQAVGSGPVPNVPVPLPPADLLVSATAVW